VINRKDFLKYAVMAGAYPAVDLRAQAQVGSNLKTTEPQKITLANKDLRLSISVGLALKCQLIHIPFGTVLADGDYSYSFGEPVFSVLLVERSSVSVGGTTKEGIHVEHRFKVDPDSPWIEEEITVRNTNLRASCWSESACCFRGGSDCGLSFLPAFSCH
jgi:hypothetical protein